MSDQSSPAAYFEALYASSPDPWGYSTAAYEHAKYAATLDALPRPQFRSGFEIGCSIGVFTRLLAARCGALLAVDFAEAALQRARENCHDLDSVKFRRLRIPAEWTEQSFDLVVISEVLYYLSGQDISRTAGKIIETLDANGVVVLVHWLGDTGAAHSGDSATAPFLAATKHALRIIAQQRTPHYRLDVLSRSHGSAG